MFKHLRANLLLIVFTMVICCVLYPLALLAIGQTIFRHRAQGGLLDAKGEPTDAPEEAVGARLIAQPFTGDGYFQPRPSAASYNASASGASNWGASNYLLRDRVARQLGPIVKYGSGIKKGQPVGPDVEAWFAKDRYQGKPGIVGQWAQAHPGVAAAWVKADKLNGDFVTAWMAAHPAEVAAWVKENPGTPEPKPEDVAVPFFVDFAKSHPATFPSIVESKAADGKTEKSVKPVKEGSDVQGTFFDMYLQEHPTVEMESVPADMVTASGSGLDPHITLKNALYQLDRIVAKWASDTRRKPEELRKEIEALLHEKKEAPLLGLAGVDLINVLEVNLALRAKYAEK